MKVLIACEESQRVCIAFRNKGHEAYSCDILECSGGHPEWHIQRDVLDVLNPKDHGNNTLDAVWFITMDGKFHEVSNWDMIIAFPPCTYLTNASAVRMRVNGEIVPERYNNAMKAKEFFMKFYNADCEKVAIENPTPLKIVDLPPYTQAIQPYFFGSPYSKRTCLWLKGLNPLKPTNIIDDHKPWVNGGCKDAHGNYRRFTGRNERDPINRSKTFIEIAEAMADQWG